MSRTQPPPRSGALRYLTPKVLLPVLGVLAAAVIGLGVVVALSSSTTTTVVNIESCTIGAADPNCKLRQPTHQHANFAVVIEGVKWDFSQAKYLSQAGGEELSPIAHIHEPRYDVVHVHYTGTTWGEFFATLGFKLTDPSLIGTDAAHTCLTTDDGVAHCSNGDKKLRFFVNGVEADGIQQYEITDLDRVLITYGNYTDEQIKAQLLLTGDDACIPSERCKSRIPVGEPPEPCTGTGVCTK